MRLSWTLLWIIRSQNTDLYLWSIIDQLSAAHYKKNIWALKKNILLLFLCSFWNGLVQTAICWELLQQGHWISELLTAAFRSIKFNDESLNVICESIQLIHSNRMLNLWIGHCFRILDRVMMSSVLSNSDVLFQCYPYKLILWNSFFNPKQTLTSTK